MLLSLALIPAALAVPKVFSEQIALLAVAPDGHHVLLGTIGSHGQGPSRLVERDVATGASSSSSCQREPIQNSAMMMMPKNTQPGSSQSYTSQVVTALATCEAYAPCPAFDLAWRPGAWVAMSNPAPNVRWTLLAPGPDGWSLGGGDTCANEGTLFTPCQARDGADTLDLQARPDEIRLTLEVEGRARTVRLSRARLARLGVHGDPWGGVVLWGSDGVLVAFPGDWAEEGQAVEPLLLFVLPTR